MSSLPLAERWPTNVAVWQIVDKDVKLMEVKYIGTPEGADYRRVADISIRVPAAHASRVGAVVEKREGGPEIAL